MKVTLPQVAKKGKLSFEEAVCFRRTIRSFRESPLELGQLSQLLWASNGVVDPATERRTIPSAGALYPVEVYVVVGKGGVEGLEDGVFHYLPFEHALLRIKEGDLRSKVAQASLWQMWMAQAPVIFVFCAEYARTTSKYRERGIRYVLMEIGHAAQNLFLQSFALGLGAGIVGAFYDEEVKTILDLQRNHDPLLLMPVGLPR